MPITLEALQLVDAISRRGSFAGAAAELGRVPSAVTHAVRKLEADLDAKLFDRAGYRAQLTPAGVELLREGRHLLSAAGDLVRRVQRVADGWEPELRIALDSIVPFARLAPTLARFCDRAPTRLRIAHEVLGGTWDAIVTGRADLAIGAVQEGPQPALLGAGYRSFELGRVDFVLAVSPTHPLAASAPPLPVAELRRHRQIVVGDTSQGLAPRTAGLIGLQDVLTVPSMDAKIAAQIAGLGVGYLPSHLARDAIARGELIALTTEHGRSDAGRNVVHVAWRADARGMALDWWVEELAKPAVRARLLA
jgi:DNA-binding transcriptional LysR family regulator